MDKFVEDIVIKEIAWHPNNSLLAIGSYEGIVYILDYLNDQIITKLPTPNFSTVNHLAWSPDGKYLFVAQNDGNPNLNIWDNENSEFISGVQTLVVSDILWNKMKNEILVTYAMPHMHLYEDGSLLDKGYIGFTLEEIKQHIRDDQPIGNYLTQSDWDTNGDFIVSGSLDGLVTLWDTANNIQVFQFSFLQGNDPYTSLYAIQDVWFSPDDSTFNSTNYDGNYTRWNTKTGDTLLDLKINDQQSFSVISPDKTKLAYIDENNELHIIEIIYEATLEDLQSRTEACVTEQGIQTSLLAKLKNNPQYEAFINELVAQRGKQIPTDCANELLIMVAQIQE